MIIHNIEGNVLWDNPTARSRRDAAISAVAEGSNLEGANLERANLAGASLVCARLTGANLTGASLASATLEGATLTDANLTGANLAGASLVCASLDGASLTYTQLISANTDEIRTDIYEILSHARAEVPGLLRRLREGRVNGSAYAAECCCLIGSLAAERGCTYRQLPGIVPDTSRPAERWFLAIHPGDIPEKSPVAQLTEEWIEAFWAVTTYGPDRH